MLARRVVRFRINIQPCRSTKGRARYAMGRSAVRSQSCKDRVEQIGGAVKHGCMPGEPMPPAWTEFGAFGLAHRANMHSCEDTIDPERMEKTLGLAMWVTGALQLC